MSTQSRSKDAAGPRISRLLGGCLSRILGAGVGGRVGWWQAGWAGSVWLVAGGWEANFSASLASSLPTGSSSSPLHCSLIIRRGDQESLLEVFQWLGNSMLQSSKLWYLL